MGIPVLKIFNFALSVTPKSGFPILDSDLLIASVSNENSVDVIKSLWSKEAVSDTTTNNGGSALIPWPGLALQPEKDLRKLPGSHLGQLGCLLGSYLGQTLGQLDHLDSLTTPSFIWGLKAALLNNDAFKPPVLWRHDYFVRQNETGTSQLKAQALPRDYKTEFFPAVGCSYAESRRITIS